VRRRLVLLGVLVSAAVVVAVAALPAPRPKEFVSAQHKFRVQFGGPPEVTANVGAGSKSNTYTVESPAGALTVIITEMPVPDGDPPERAPLYLNSARDDLIRAAGGERVSSASITLAGKYPGCEFRARFRQPQPGAMRARLYLVGKRLYQVMAIGTEEFVSAPAATTFLNSFMVTE
jgi:hypothetical protein